MATEQVVAAWDTLSGTINAVVGCAVFAPDDDRKRDLPGLIETMRDAEMACEEALYNTKRQVDELLRGAIESTDDTDRTARLRAALVPFGGQ